MRRHFPRRAHIRETSKMWGESDLSTARYQTMGWGETKEQELLALKKLY
jgi:hypothetical protein